MLLNGVTQSLNKWIKDFGLFHLLGLAIEGGPYSDLKGPDRSNLLNLFSSHHQKQDLLQVRWHPDQRTNAVQNAVKQRSAPLSASRH